MSHKIANFVVNKSKKESVATFAVQRNNVPELKDFLNRMCNIENEEGMNVIILDNLQHAGKLGMLLLTLFFLQNMNLLIKSIFYKKIPKFWWRQKNFQLLPH